MKFCFSLAILCISVSLCHGACFFQTFEAGTKNDGCIDPYDDQKHPFGSSWNTDKCLECHCEEAGMQCCDRFGGPVFMEGCVAILSPETCEYKFFKEDDLTEPCILKNKTKQ